jgi:sec-independent protein translocase protein TatA
MFSGSLGVGELLLVLGIVLLIFGPKRLPGLGKQLGQGLREFKDSVTGRHDGKTGLEDGAADDGLPGPDTASVAETPRVEAGPKTRG